MEEQIWTRDPSVLIRNSSLMYVRGASAAANANSIARFILLWTLLGVVVTGRASILIVGAVLLLFSSSSSINSSSRSSGSSISSSATSASAAVGVFVDETGNVPFYRYCQLPTPENPSANTMSHHVGGGTKLPACPSDMVTDMLNQALDATTLVDGGKLPGEDIDPQSTHMRRLRAYSMPSTTIIPDLDAFVHATMGGNIRRASDMSQWTEVDMWRNPRFLYSK